MEETSSQLTPRLQLYLLCLFTIEEVFIENYVIFFSTTGSSVLT